jgi:GTPase SAR1 family protein
MYIPSNIEDAYNQVDPALPLEQGDSRYVNFGTLRGENDEIAIMERRITLSRGGDYVCQLFTGHRGSGKTTELKRLKHRLEQRNYQVVYFDVEDALDINDIDYPDVLLTVAEQVQKQLGESSTVHLKPELLTDITNWFDEVTTEENKERQVQRILSAEAGLGADALFARLLASVRGEIKNSSGRRITIRSQLERRSGELIQRVNFLIGDALVQLERQGKRGLVLLVDGLEKVLHRVIDEKSGLNSHNQLFVYHGDQLRSLNCHLVYTYPINLMFDHNIVQIFPQTTILPMVKVIDREGKRSEEGYAYMRQVLAQRLDIAAIFSSAELVNRLIEASGGHLRDFLRLTQYAMVLTDKCVGPGEVERAINKGAVEYDYLVRAEDVNRLREIHRTKQVPSDPHHALLLYNLLALEYLNGGRWADVHPLVRRLPKFQG